MSCQNQLMNERRMKLTLLLWACIVMSSCAFAPIATTTDRMATRGNSLNMLEPSQFTSFSSSSELLSIDTFDPTQLFSDLLVGLIGGPAILLVPILAAVAVASLIAFLIVGYASPQVEDYDEED
mmetsp:Transcript_10946/g.16127  ORF Transcript_10946/g.16127 Transcript_10946/m.16127 type:complete len:124 (-) Transcript_10946:62-433(-)